MWQWKFVCGCAALCAVELVKGKPIHLDLTQNSKMVEYLDSDFPGIGTRWEKTSEPEYEPGTLNPPTEQRRRLELAKSTDMKKLETFFGVELETDITKLAAQCEADPVPWPSGYWPVYADSINYRWSKHGRSPAEKYALAFGYDVKILVDTISAKKGIDSMSNRTKCTHESHCIGQKDGSTCSKRHKKDPEGICIPKWFGSCHAWAPASILEAEPSCRVERNGIIFEPYDIKALITLAYDGSKIPIIFTGTRFNGNDSSPKTFDSYGRFRDERRRDISPGFFHIAVTNLLSRFKHSFVIDISSGKEVWNQPVRSYEILRLSWTTPTAAAKRYFKRKKYPFNDAATKIAVVTTRLSWIVEAGANGPLVSTGLVEQYTTSADYDYILETDETYQILGGEWLLGSKKNHPDFLWIPGNKPDKTTVTPVGLVYSEIEELLIESTQSVCKPVSTRKKSKTTSSDDSSSTNTETSSPETPANTPSPEETPENAPEETSENNSEENSDDASEENRDKPPQAQPPLTTSPAHAPPKEPSSEDPPKDPPKDPSSEGTPPKDPPKDPPAQPPQPATETPAQSPQPATETLPENTDLETQTPHVEGL